VASPSSIRFDPSVLERLHEFVAAHPGWSLSSASNLLVDEALRMQAHPMIVFRDGPVGRRAKLVGGPDVWEVVRATQSARRAEPGLSADEVVALVAETSGVAVDLVRAGLGYWAEFPDEVDAFVAHAAAFEQREEARWRRERELLET
jgi:hypothetical protein